MQLPNIEYIFFSEEYQKWKKITDKSAAFFCVNFQPFLKIGSNLEPNSQQVATIKCLEDGITDNDFIVAFADPCTIENQAGWPLRNLLLLIMKHNPKRLHEGMLIISFRQEILFGKGDSPNKVTAANSYILRVKCLPVEKHEEQKADSAIYTMDSLFKGEIEIKLTILYYFAF